MSEQVSGRRDGSNIMVTTGPDVLLTPMGSGMVPVAYSSVAFFDPSERLSRSVRNNANNDFQLNTRSARMTGHEAGIGKGVVVPGHMAYSHVKTASSNVFSEGWAVVRNEDPAWMNHPDVGPTEPRRGIKSVCAAQIEAIDRETKAAADIADPIERNKAITAAYTKLAAEDPANRWIKLASVVSVQGGCAMKQVAGVRSHFPSFKDGLDDKTGMSFTKNMYNALGDANKAIFSDIYPMAAYRARHGYEQMKKCYAAGNKPIPRGIDEAFRKLDAGDLPGGADAIAGYEQQTVVQGVYDKYSGTFGAMETMSSVSELAGQGKLYEIPVSTTCGDSNTVPFVGSISNGDDRVGYYRALMSRLSSQQGW